MNKLLGLLLGIGVGAALSFLFPPERVLSFFGATAQVVIHVGRYVLFPLLFFKMVSSIVQHQKGHNYMRLHLYLLALSLAITAFLVMVGKYDSISLAAT